MQPQRHLILFLDLTCEPFEHSDILETLEVVDEHIGDPKIIEELQGHWIPELRLHRVVCPNSERKVKMRHWARWACCVTCSPATGH